VLGNHHENIVTSIMKIAKQDIPEKLNVPGAAGIEFWQRSRLWKHCGRVFLA
jgi:hypothetical protein